MKTARDTPKPTTDEQLPVRERDDTVNVVVRIWIESRIEIAGLSERAKRKERETSDYNTLKLREFTPPHKSCCAKILSEIPPFFNAIRTILWKWWVSVRLFDDFSCSGRAGAGVVGACIRADPAGHAAGDPAGVEIVSFQGLAGPWLRSAQRSRHPILLKVRRFVHPFRWQQNLYCFPLPQGQGA